MGIGIGLTLGLGLGLGLELVRTKEMCARKSSSMSYADRLKYHTLERTLTPMTSDISPRSRSDICVKRPLYEARRVYSRVARKNCRMRTWLGVG